MPKLCLCQAYLFEKTCYQANPNRVSYYKSLHCMDPLFICVKFGITVPSIFGFNHILIQRNKRINLVTIGKIDSRFNRLVVISCFEYIVEQL